MGVETDAQDPSEERFWAHLAAFTEQLQAWQPAALTPPEEFQQWTINPDGSVTITLPSTLAANLADELREWSEMRGWVDRPDCQNWKRSPIARENRRESIVYGNNLESIKCLLGRKQVLAFMARVAAIDADAHAAQGGDNNDNDDNKESVE